MKELCIITLLILPVTASSAADSPYPYQATGILLNEEEDFPSSIFNAPTSPFNPEVSMNEATDSQAHKEGSLPYQRPKKRRRLLNVAEPESGNSEGHYSSNSSISTSLISDDERQFEIEDPPYLTQEESNSFLKDLSSPSPEGIALQGIPNSNTKSISRNKIDNILGLNGFIRQKRAEKWGPERIAEAWNKQHPEQTISHSTILKWLKENGFSRLQQSNKIDSIPELKSFIRQKRAEKWGPFWIENAWNKQHPEQIISDSAIRKWLEENGLAINLREIRNDESAPNASTNTVTPAVVENNPEGHSSNSSSSTSPVSNERQFEIENPLYLTQEELNSFLKDLSSPSPKDEVYRGSEEYYSSDSIISLPPFSNSNNDQDPYPYECPPNRPTVTSGILQVQATPKSNTKSISRNKIDKNPELESFIRQKRAERWGGGENRKSMEWATPRTNNSFVYNTKMA